MTTNSFVCVSEPARLLAVTSRCGSTSSQALTHDPAPTDQRASRRLSSRVRAPARWSPNAGRTWQDSKPNALPCTLRRLHAPVLLE